MAASRLLPDIQIMMRDRLFRDAQRRRILRNHTGNIMVENIFEELDSPGEWYYDNAKGKLYLWPQAGVDLSNVTVEGAVTEELLHVEGTQDGT